MDFTESNVTPLRSPPHHDPSQEESCVASITEELETTCWGCGSHLILASYAPIFKCGWCGAITNQNRTKHENTGFWWRRLRDRCFVCILVVFMLFVICGGVWAIYPVVFSISYFCGIFHSMIAALLSVTTISTFCLAAFRCAGAPPVIPWGTYRFVGKGGLENYTFCHYCSKPKSPRTHHCRSCRMCIVDMDHHCPFIGNCVGAANHRWFIAFLLSTVIGTTYVSIMSAYAGLHIWPPLKYNGSLDPSSASGSDSALRMAKEIILAFLRSTVFVPARGLVLIYLFISSVSVEIGLSVLLWQQLCYIYEGNTYLSHLSSQGREATGERDCQNLVRFFGFPYSALWYLPTFRSSRKKHKK